MRLISDSANRGQTKLHTRIQVEATEVLRAEGGRLVDTEQSVAPAHGSLAA